MKIFIDTSAFYAMMDAQDDFHPKANDFFIETIHHECLFYASDDILVETLALLQNRLGRKASRSFVEHIMPLFALFWVDQRIHERVLRNLLLVSGSKNRFVDYRSFQIMRDQAIKSAFSLDDPFRLQGFDFIPYSETSKDSFQKETAVP